MLFEASTRFILVLIGNIFGGRSCDPTSLMLVGAHYSDLYRVANVNNNTTSVADKSGAPYEFGVAYEAIPFVLAVTVTCWRGVWEAAPYTMPFTKS